MPRDPRSNPPETIRHEQIPVTPAERGALQECNPSTEPSVDCESVPPRFGITPNRGCFPGMPSQPRLKRKTHPLYCRPLGRFHHHFTPELCHTAEKGMRNPERQVDRL